MTSRPRRVQPTRISRSRAVDYSDSPDADEHDCDEQTDSFGSEATVAQRSTVPAPFQTVRDAVDGGLAKSAAEIPGGSSCHILARCIGDPDFYIVGDGLSQYAVAIAEVSKYVPNHLLVMFENAVFTYQDTLMSNVDKGSRLSGMNPENALRAFTQAAWVLPTVCSECQCAKSSHSLVTCGERSRSPPGSVSSQSCTTSREYVGLLESDSSDASSDSPRPEDRNSAGSYIARIKSLEERLAAAQTFRQARSSKSLMNDRRKIRRLERDVHALEERLRRHDEREVKMEALIATLRAREADRMNAGQRACPETRDEETDDDLPLRLHKRRAWTRDNED